MNHRVIKKQRLLAMGVVVLALMASCPETNSGQVEWGAISGQSPANGTSTTDTTPTFSWDAVPDAAGYELQLADSAAGLEASQTQSVTDTTYTPPSALAKGQTHYWRVRAVGGDDQKGPWSAVHSLAVSLQPLTSLTYPATPLNAEAGVQISDITPTLTPDGASGIYTVSPPLPDGLILHDTSGVISGTPTVLHDSTVHTVTATGNEAYSGTVTADITVEVFSEIEAVEIPKRAAATDVRDSYVLFSISADQLKTDYHLAVKEAAEPAPTPAEMSSGALKRNIGTDAINVLIAQRLNAPMIDFARTYFADNSQTTLGTNMQGLYLQNDFGFIFDNTAVGAEAWVAESILKESTEYALYGMENGGTQVIRLLTATTDSLLSSPTAPDDTLTLFDTTLERGHIEIAVNANEYYIFPHQSELNPTVGDIFLDFLFQ